MKYRRLTLKELESLEQEFIYFLVANGIPAEVWMRIKNEDPSKMNALLDEFSEMVFQTSIDKAEYLLHVRKQELMLFHCQQMEMQLYTVSVNNPNLDLASFETFEKLTEAIRQVDEIQKITFSKPYRPDRSQTIYELMENGCGICDKSTFELVGSFF